MPRFGLDYRRSQQTENPTVQKNDQEALLGTRAVKDESSEGSVRYERRQREWPFDDARMANIETDFPRLFPEKGNNFIDERLSKTGRQQVILDWGCARGYAAEEFGQKYGDQVMSMGYSMDSYKNWADARHSTLIQSPADQLFDELDEMGRPVDLVYSRVGLVYLFPGASSTEQVPMERGVKYIHRLLNHLSEDGMVAFDIGQPQAEKIAEALRIAFNGEEEVILDDNNLEGDHQIYITKLPRKKTTEPSKISDEHILARERQDIAEMDDIRHRIGINRPTAEAAGNDQIQK